MESLRALHLQYENPLNRFLKGQILFAFVLSEEVMEKIKMGKIVKPWQNPPLFGQSLEAPFIYPYLCPGLLLLFLLLQEVWIHQLRMSESVPSEALEKTKEMENLSPSVPASKLRDVNPPADSHDDDSESKRKKKLELNRIASRVSTTCFMPHKTKNCSRKQSTFILPIKRKKSGFDSLRRVVFPTGEPQAQEVKTWGVAEVCVVSNSWEPPVARTKWVTTTDAGGEASWGFSSHCRSGSPLIGAGKDIAVPAPDTKYVMLTRPTFILGRPFG